MIDPRSTRAYKLEKENKKLKEENERLQKCYCERTDCAGRIKNSAKFPSIQEENKELKQKVKYYENFEINKTLDKIRLENNKREKDLQKQLQQKENIIKEVREILLNYGETFDLKVHQDMQKKLLEILEKGSDK